MGKLMENKREIGIITAEIRALTSQAQATVLQYAMEIGRRLCEAKSQLEHGEWGEWLKNEVRFSKSTANNFMRIFEGYSTKQIGFITESNFQTLGDLSYTKALALLAVPEEEREEFASEVKASEISVRELEEKIKAREAEAEKAQKEKEEAISKAQKSEKEVAEMWKDIERLKKGKEQEREARDAIVSEAEKKLKEGIKAELEAAEKKAKDAEAEAERARREAEALRANPVIPKELADKMRKEEKEKAEAAAAKALTEAEEKLRNAEAMAEEEKRKAEALMKETGEKLAAAEKAAAMADPDAVLFREIFGRIQKECITAREILERIGEKDREKEGKFREALKKVLSGF